MADPSRNPAVDAYIAARPPFAQPILTRIRDAVHAACPEAVETIKLLTASVPELRSS